LIAVEDANFESDPLAEFASEASPDAAPPRTRPATAPTSVAPPSTSVSDELVEIRRPRPTVKILVAISVVAAAMIVVGMTMFFWRGVPTHEDMATPQTKGSSSDVETGETAALGVTPERTEQALGSEQEPDLPSGKAPGDAPSVSSAPPSPHGSASRLSDASSLTSGPIPIIRPADVDNVTAYSPSFGPSGNSIFFHTGRGAPTSLLNASLSGDRALVGVTTIVRDGASNYHVQVSPDESRIAFDSDRDGERGVYVADRDGSHARRVSGFGYAAIPSWSPDGSRLAFVRAEPARPNVWNVWSAELATNDLQRLTSHRVGQPWGGSWFPDSRRLAYSHEDRLIVINTQTTAVERVFPSPVRGRLVRTPAVSPDGRWIVFQVYRDGTWKLDVTDGSMRRILDDRSAEEFAWAPDGSVIAYHSHRSGEWSIWLARP
jgi:hypothetical protein